MTGERQGAEGVAELLERFLQAYPEDVFPTPPREKQAIDAAAAHVMRELAYPTMREALGAIRGLQAELERFKLLLIEATNPGIDMERVKAERLNDGPGRV